MQRSIALALFVAAGIQSGQSCTTIVVGKAGTADGSVMASHSNDGEGTTDPRLVKVPAQDWEPGSMRKIYPNPENYPRFVGDRGVKQYYPTDGQDVSVAVGEIPQVNHTYAYFEETYGVMNEFQVGIGESTCSAVYSAQGPQDGGSALFSVDELSRVAMERCKTSRCAVQLMGDLAETYGFHGQDNSFEGGGESLMVTDKNEGFVFHILADSTGTSAIWVAQRVPDAHIAVVANMYTIREVDLSDTDNFLGSADMWDLAEKGGLWQQGQPKDFTATFSDGEYAHKYYSGRRMWGSWRIASPSQNIPPTYGDLRMDKPYPFSVPVDTPLTVKDLFTIHRDWYADTPYDLSSGLQGGFMGSPDRYSGCMGDCSNVTGNWERSIGLYRTSDSYVVQSRSWLPDNVGGTIWFGPAAAHGTLYVPIFAGMTEPPTEYADSWQGTTTQEARKVNSGFWASRAVLNTMQMQFSSMLPMVQEMQSDWEDKGLRLQKSLETVESGADLNKSTLQFVTEAVKAWWDLADDLMFRFADGCLNEWTVAKDGTKVFSSESIGYPAEWLTTDQVGFTDGPPPVGASASGKSSLRECVAQCGLDGACSAACLKKF